MLSLELSIQIKKITFSVRLLIALPEGNHYLKTYPDGVDINILKQLSNLIGKLYNSRSNLKQFVETEKSFKNEYFEWKNNVGEESFNTNNSKKNSAIGKLTQYVIRFSLIFFFLDENSEKINVSHLNKAIKLFNYFKYTAFKMIDMIDNFDPFTDLSKNDIRLIKALPDTFKTCDAIELFIGLGVENNKAKNVYNRLLRFLKTNNLVEKINHGEYERLYD